MRHPEIHAVLDEVLDGGAAYRLPELPNFGVFYLSLPKAVALILEDLKRNNQRVTFGMYEDADGTPKEREKKFLKAVSELTSDLQSRLLLAAERGKIKCFSLSRTLEDFLQRGLQQHLPELTFIHYTDLIAWLTEFGYISRLAPSEHPAFEEYERNELDLLENLENDVTARRTLLGKRIQSPLRVLAPPACEEDAHLQAQENLATALASIKELKRENQKLRARIGEARFAPLDENARQSYLRLIAAFCHKDKLDINGVNTVSMLTEATGKLEKPLSNSTIRNLLSQVDTEINGTIPDTPSASGGAKRKGTRAERRKRSEKI